ncbi:MAG: glycosyltransferase family 4 protein, partial [Okeania sp. SIO2H7]|nr:glycosyltransferase family 4 protein [Okeania sp. SIO2H7]
SAVKSADLSAPLPAEEKVFIWQRTIMTYAAHIPQLKNLLQRGYLIVAEIDDNPLRRREYADNNYLSYRGCHCVQTSTEPLADFLRQHNPNVAVFSNHLAYLPPPRNYDNSKTVTIFFGALNREQDWQIIIPSINKLLLELSYKIKFKIIHDRLFFDSLNTTNKEFEPFCSYDKYKEILYTCDIALLPLNDNPVNRMKSDLKFVECAGYGAAVLASPIVYEGSIVEGETGLIYRSAGEFEVKLKELIKNTNLRHKLAVNAYNWVRENRLLYQHYRQRRDWYLKMRDQLPRLNQELRSRVPELFVN